MQSLVDDLYKLTTKREKGFEEEVRKRMAAYVASGDEGWKKFKFTNPYKYSRNLVEINKEFEMIVLCWEAGQESPIHNHSSQDCWFAVVEGSVEEIYYHYDEKTKAISQGEAHTHNLGTVGHIVDDVALHVVRPTKGNSACTLHVYSKPIPMCNIYNPCNGEVTSRVSGFYTVFGKKYSPGDSSIYRVSLKIFSSQLYKELQNEWSESYCQLYNLCNAEGSSCQATTPASVTNMS